MTLPITALAGFAFKGYGPERLLDFIAELGLSRLDYWPWNRGDLTASEFRQLLDGRGIEVVCVNVPSTDARVADRRAEPRQLRRFVDAMEDAVTLGAAAIQVYIAVPGGEDRDATTRSLGEALKPILAEAERLGLQVTIENNLDQRGEDERGLNPARSAEALERLFVVAESAALKACYDPANFVAVGEAPFPTAYEHLRPWISNVHVKDCRPYDASVDAGVPAAGKLLVDTIAGPFLPTVVGDGSVPWAAIVSRLVADGYAGWVTLDPFIADDQLDSWCRGSVAAWEGLTSRRTGGGDD